MGADSIDDRNPSVSLGESRYRVAGASDFGLKRRAVREG
jgi:hypothetical protein